MKAIRVREFGPPAVMKLEDAPDPKPGPDEIVVRAKAVGVNPIDTYIRAGGRIDTIPYTPGSDAAGVVESGAGPFKAGDRVYTSGTTSGLYIGAYAERVLCKTNQVHPLPASISFAQGAAINVPYATAYRSIFQRAHTQAGDTVLVHGASGGVGVASVQILRAHGMMIIGTAGTERGRKLVLEEGAHHALDHTAPDYLQQLLKLTGGRGVDVVLEMAAHLNLAKDLTVVALGGRIVVIGCRGPIEINARDAMNKNAAILGMMLAHATESEKAGIHMALFAGLTNGSLKPVVGREMPLQDAPKAHEAVMAPGAYGKIVLIL